MQSVTGKDVTTSQHHNVKTQPQRKQARVSNSVYRLSKCTEHKTRIKMHRNIHIKRKKVVIIYFNPEKRGHMTLEQKVTNN